MTPDHPILRKASHIAIVGLLLVVVLTCVAQQMYAATVPVMLEWKVAPMPPVNMQFVLEAGPQTYVCTVVSAGSSERCIWQVDVAAVQAMETAWKNGLGVCWYERTHPDSRHCEWHVDMTVKQSKRRAVRH